MSERQEVCGRCVHWRIHNSAQGIEGDCRRYPPVVTMDIDTSETTDYNGHTETDVIGSTRVTVWPLTMIHDWCGEFKPIGGKVCVLPNYPPSQ